MERCSALGQLFAPGEATSYCNIATVIAGYLVQKLRGTSWYTLVKTRLFDPLGLRHALADVIDAPRFRCSIGDLTDPETGEMRQTTRPFLSPSFAPAGSTLMTSATDLVLVARALLNGGVAPNGTRILSTRAALRMTEVQGAFAAPNYQVGLGWMIMPNSVLTHTGVGPGVHATLLADPRSGRTVALLTNCDRGGVLRSRILDPIVHHWTGTQTSAPAVSCALSDLSRYEGLYENNLHRVEVLPHAYGLAMTVQMKMKLYDNTSFNDATQAKPVLQLRPIGADTFETDPSLPGGSKGEVKFVQPDASGRPRFLGMRYRLLARTQ